MWCNLRLALAGWPAPDLGAAGGSVPPAGPSDPTAAEPGEWRRGQAPSRPDGLEPPSSRRRLVLGLGGLTIAGGWLLWVAGCAALQPAVPPPPPKPEDVRLGLAPPAELPDAEAFQARGLVASVDDRKLLDASGAITGPLPGLTPAQLRTFVQGAGLFGHAFDEHEGLGPLYNAESCASCHAAGGAGGPGHQEVQRMGLADTRQADWAVRGTGFYAMPELGGPIRQGKVVGGGSEPLPTAKDVDALAKRLAAHGINAGRTVIRSERVPPMVAGDGLLSAIPDASLLARAAQAKPFGIKGRANVLHGRLQDLALEGQVGRLGHKAQLPDNETFFADAAGQQLGLSSPQNPFEHLANGHTVKVAKPDLDAWQAEAFTVFSAALAPPSPATLEVDGRQAFYKAGCAVCHYAGYTTATKPEAMPARLRDLYAALGNKPVPAYSDLLLHRMGRALADGFVQGSAEGDEWRTAPLWGLHYKTAYMHGGTAATLEEAIRLHKGEGSEANAVVENYLGSGSDAGHNLTQEERQALIRFLQGL